MTRILVKLYLTQSLTDTKAIHKTITSQNVSSEALVNNFFLFYRKVMFRSRDIQVFVLLTIP